MKRIRALLDACRSVETTLQKLPPGKRLVILRHLTQKLEKEAQHASDQSGSGNHRD